MRRPDFSEYVAHFTKPAAPYGRGDHFTEAVAAQSPRQRLESILKERRIFAGTVPWAKLRAVCFSECPWTSLIDHAKQYSSFGIGFRKELLFKSGGGPAQYVRSDIFRKQEWHPDMRVFMTPFWPEYRPPQLAEHDLFGKRIDYSHEREWRVPQDFTFALRDVEFVVVESLDDIAALPRDLVDEIGRDRFLIMETYRRIEELWPTHIT